MSPASQLPKQFTGRQQTVYRSLSRKDAEVAELYGCTLRTLQDNGNAGRIFRVLSATHYRTDHIKCCFIKEEFRGKAWWVERHRQTMAMRTTVRFVSVVFDVLEQNRPERVFTGSDDRFRQTVLEHAISVVVKFDNCFVRAQIIIPAKTVPQEPTHSS
jgi:hypothetical protein